MLRFPSTACHQSAVARYHGQSHSACNAHKRSDHCLFRHELFLQASVHACVPAVVYAFAMPAQVKYRLLGMSRHDAGDHLDLQSSAAEADAYALGMRLGAQRVMQRYIGACNTQVR